jgi:two-component system sensor histidine kinase/response regulator
MEQGGILVVDDAPAAVDSLTRTLAALGYRLRTVGTGQGALAAAAEDRPDAVVLNTSLPDIDGYTVCERMKQSELLRDIPVIFRSPIADPLARRRAFAAGGADYIAEPCPSGEVAGRIDAHAKVHVLERQLWRERELLADRHRKLTEAELLRDGFVNMLMHDLRSPLTAMMANLELLQIDAEKVAGEVARLDLDQLAEARRMSAIMARMISDMLAVSRFEAGKMPVRAAQCDLVDIVRDALASLQVRDRVRVVAPAGPLPVVCDADLIRRVLTNLAANAARFTSAAGRVEISIQAEDADWRISVSDEGPPLPLALHERIFQKLGQVDAGVRTALGPSGLGLTFCKMAVDAHGGRIGVHSQAERGRTFWFAIPRAVA